MARRLNDSDPTFGRDIETLLALDRDDGANVEDVVRDILGAVKREGFAAVARFTNEFDQLNITEEAARISDAEISRAVAQCDPAALESLEFAAKRIRAYHEKQLPVDVRYKDDEGVSLGWRWTSVDAAGLYAPGGRAAYPSSVLMNAIPAQVAGVKSLVMVSPSPGGEMNPLVLAAAQIAGVSEIYPIGGAQSIAALAYGACPVPRVDVIVGPGNAYVAEAKRQVFGHVGIDSIAGPSEILVVADERNDPEWIAADLLSQAEHDPSSQSILITDDAGFADSVACAADRQIAENPRKEIAGAAWRNHSAIIVIGSLADAPALINQIAPEHLELAVDEPEAMLARIRHAGAIFLGRYTPEAIGDYVAGPDHVLPTGRAARYASGLSVMDFMKRSSIIACDETAIGRLGPHAARLADFEGLPAHAHSVRVRFKKT